MRAHKAWTVRTKSNGSYGTYPMKSTAIAIAKFFRVGPDQVVRTIHFR